MKVGLKTIVFVGDSGGFADAISSALNPPPHSSVRVLEESFELDMYGFRDQKAAGRIVHYVDESGIYQVSVLHLEDYKMPILAWVLGTVLQHISKEESSAEPTLVFPFLISPSKHKRDTKCVKLEEKRSFLFGLLLGPETGVSQALAAKTRKPPLVLEIDHEPLARVHHIVRVLNLAAFILIGLEGQKHDLELVNEIGELLGDDSYLSYSKEKLVWNSASKSRKHAKPWLACMGRLND